MAVAAAASLLSSSGSPRKATSTGNLLGPVSGSQQQLLVSSQSLKTPLHGNKFKTGGIVVTAAQPLHSRQQRSKTGGHLRAVRTPSNSNINQQQSSSTSPTKLPTTTTIDIQLTTLCSETESSRNDDQSEPFPTGPEWKIKAEAHGKLCTPKDTRERRKSKHTKIDFSSKISERIERDRFSFVFPSPCE